MTPDDDTNELGASRRNPERFFHPGEVQIQAESGSDTAHYESMSRQMMIPDLKPNEAVFVEERTFSIAATIDAQGRPWSSPLLQVGAQLFTVETPTVIDIATVRTPGDPLHANVDSMGELGVLFFDPATRRRSKSIGTATTRDDGHIRYEMTRNFGLCPKYIVKRTHEPTAQADSARTEPLVSTTLNAKDQAQLTQTDTIFFASFYRDHGADSTHRGGLPGFVQVRSETELVIPDYFGNGMFNTIGNLMIDPRLAITTVDFATGRTLHLTGTATVERIQRPEKSIDRMIHFQLGEMITSQAPIGSWGDAEPSRYAVDVHSS